MLVIVSWISLDVKVDTQVPSFIGMQTAAIKGSMNQQPVWDSFFLYFLPPPSIII